MFTIVDDIICPLFKFIGFMTCKTSKIISAIICIFIGVFGARKIFKRNSI